MSPKVLYPKVPGNTKPGTFRNFQLTLNDNKGNLMNKYENLKNYLTNLKNLSYFLSVKEIGEKTKNEHIHIYIHFKEKSRLSTKKTEGAHIEICNGSPQQNIGYLLKNLNQQIAQTEFKEYEEYINEERQKKNINEENEESILLDEIGTRPRQGKKNFNFEEVSKLTQEDILNNEDLNLIQKKTLLNIKKDISNKPIKASEFLKNYYKKNDHFHIFYITGPSGCGKTRYALKLIQDYINFYGDTYLDEIDTDGKFINGAHEGAEICLYDEFRDHNLKFDKFLKFIDYNKHTFNIKGSFITNNYKLIIFTSVISLDNIYINETMNNQEDFKQLTRRIIYINFYENKPNFEEIYKFN